MTPSGVEVMHYNGHAVFVEGGAGIPSGFDDSDYTKVGAQIMYSPSGIFDRADMIVRVKEPQPCEYDLLKEGQIYFSYLHLAACQEVTQTMIRSGSIGIAYETIQKSNGSFRAYAHRSNTVEGPTSKP
jgi:alanine dehydrogenase